MYLADVDLLQLLPQLEICVEDGSDPFNAQDQIQSASIDLRLSHVFWRPKRRWTVDLRRSKLLELQPRRYYSRSDLRTGEAVTINPGELLLGRTLEEFTIPNGYVAELVGRSSFARMGLMVTASGGHINPGWRGRMPLQIVNLGPNPVRLVPGLPICQIRVAKMLREAERPYGHPELQSKYVSDDGGPSYWWRDKRVRHLHTVLSEKAVEARIQQDLGTLIGTSEPEVIERLERIVGRLRLDDLNSLDAILDRFTRAEDRRRAWRRWGINIARGSFTIAVSASLWIANRTPFRWWHYLTWAGAIGVLCVSAYAFRTEVGEHFGAAELRTRRLRSGSD